MRLTMPSVPKGWTGRTATLVVMMGLPGSGKSTVAQTRRAANPDRCLVLCRDTERELNGCLPVGSRRQEDAITIVVESSAAALLSAGYDVIIDATNLHQGAEENWRSIAAACKAQMEIIDLRAVPIDVCIHRDKRRGMAGGRYVTGPVIRSLARRYLPRKPAEQVPSGDPCP